VSYIGIHVWRIIWLIIYAYRIEYRKFHPPQHQPHPPRTLREDVVVKKESVVPKPLGLKLLLRFPQQEARVGERFTCQYKIASDRIRLHEIV
jgi:hypothetical protein